MTRQSPTLIENIKWHDELLRRGFTLLEAKTRTYGNGIFTGSIVKESKHGKIRVSTDKDYDKGQDIFSPFVKKKADSIRIRTLEQLDSQCKN